MVAKMNIAVRRQRLILCTNNLPNRQCLSTSDLLARQQLVLYLLKSSLDLYKQLGEPFVRNLI